MKILKVLTLLGWGISIAILGYFWFRGRYTLVENFPYASYIVSIIFWLAAGIYEFFLIRKVWLKKLQNS